MMVAIVKVVPKMMMQVMMMKLVKTWSMATLQRMTTLALMMQTMATTMMWLLLVIKRATTMRIIMRMLALAPMIMPLPRMRMLTIMMLMLTGYYDDGADANAAADDYEDAGAGPSE